MTKGDKKKCSMCRVPFERNNYYNGKLMTARDFHTEQNYFNEKRWLLNRKIHGRGIVCGLDVEPVANDPNQVKVTEGLAIDCCGREIHVCEDQYILLDPEYSECNKPVSVNEKKYIVCIEFQECKTEEVHNSPVCYQKVKSDFNRIRDSFNIRVIPFFEKMTKKKHFCQSTIEEREKSMHQYLCDRLRKGCPKSCPEIKECHEPSCVILAVASLENGTLYLENCSRRRLVYTNPLLYDLIYCFHGDLPHISNINWISQHGKPIDWYDDFENLVSSGLSVTFNKLMNHNTINIHTFLVAVITREERTGYRLLKYIPSKENKIITEDKNGVTIATFIFEEDWAKEEIPAKYSLLTDGAEFEIILRGSSIFSEKEYLFNWPENQNDSDRLIEFLKWKFNAKWIRKDLIEINDDEIAISNIIYLKLYDDSKVDLTINGIKTDEFYVKIEQGIKNIYGRGKALDGSFQGILPSGNGTQGSDFVSWFFVNPRN